MLFTLRRNQGTVVFLLGRFCIRDPGGTAGRGLDVTTQARSIVDANARRDYTALDAAGGPELDAVRGLEISYDVAVHNDLAGFEIGLNTAARTHGEAARTDAHFALNIAINIHVRTPGDLAADFEPRTDAGIDIRRQRSRSGGRSCNRGGSGCCHGRNTRRGR